jgi:hypothetical protein
MDKNHTQKSAVIRATIRNSRAIRPQPGKATSLSCIGGCRFGSGVDFMPRILAASARKSGGETLPSLACPLPLEHVSYFREHFMHFALRHRRRADCEAYPRDGLREILYATGFSARNEYWAAFLA